MITAVLQSSPGWARTSDNSINSRVLCQLSYRGLRLATLRTLPNHIGPTQIAILLLLGWSIGAQQGVHV